MELNHFSIKSIVSKVFVESYKKTIKRFLFISLAIILLKFVVQCEGKDRYYRPNLPEKLCSVGIIDADDTSDYDFFPESFDNRTSARFISFEKSYQEEYPGEVNDSLREFSFSISSSDEELFSFNSDAAIKNFKGFKIPADIDFRTDEKYYLHAQEQNTPEISAVIEVPEIPSKPNLISLENEITQLPRPTECIGYTEAKTSVIDFSFDSYGQQDHYYAILLEGIGSNLSSSFPIHRSQLEFAVRHSNTAGFFASMNGFTMYQFTCLNNRSTMIKVPVYAYFIEGSKIPDNKCIIKISTQFLDDRAPFEFISMLRVRLLSIPKELFLFEKSLYTYKQTSSDPFTEPVYLNGNIKGGNGVFAICRSSEFSIKFSPWY